MHHNCVLCKVFACFHVFSEWIRRKNQTFHFREKCAFAPNAFFSRKYRFYFRSETENERAERAELRSGGRTPVRRSGEAKPRQAKPLPKSSGASEMRREASEARRPSLTERAERASIYRPSAVASNSAEEKCSLFVVSSPFWGAAMHPIGEETEKRRNGTEAAQFFLLSFVHEYGNYF